MKTQRAIELFTLGFTSLLLVAHGGNESLCMLDDAETVTFDVVGECGPAGRIRVTMDGCTVVAEGDDVGLPTSGSGDDIRRGGWSLKGPLPARPDQEVSCGVTWLVSGEQTNRYEITCYANHEPVCSSYLIESTESCEVTSCSVPSCAEDSRLSLAADACCPTCVECPSCVPPEPEPEPEPEPCDESTCPESCAEGYELVYEYGECCAACTPAPDPQLCAAGRAQFDAEVDQAKTEWLSCSDDSECFVFSPDSRCGSLCNLLASGPEYGEPYSNLQNRAQELCMNCPPPEHTCGNDVPPRARCVNGTCQVAP